MQDKWDYIMMTGLRDPRQAKSGTKFIHPQRYSHFRLDQKEHDTATNNESSSVLYASVHPLEVGSFDALVMAVEKLSLNDSGLNVQKTSSNNSNNSAGSYLGPGLRIGFQGLLHIEVFRQRLFDEFQLEAIVTPPKVPYTIHYFIPKNNNKRVAPNRQNYLKLHKSLKIYPNGHHRHPIIINFEWKNQLYKYESCHRWNMQVTLWI